MGDADEPPQRGRHLHQDTIWYVDRGIAELRQYIDLQDARQEQSLTTSVEQINIRLEAMNKFREQLREQTQGFLPRAEYESNSERSRVLHATLADHVDRLEKVGDRNGGAVAALRFLLVLLGLPGIIALLWALLAAFSGRTAWP